MTCARLSRLTGFFVVPLILTVGCSDYGILEGDNPQIIALKRLGAKVQYGMPGGYYIELQNTGVDDDDLIHFEELPEVLTVDLSATNITDEGLHHLVTGPKHLKSLILDETDITDAGIEILKGLQGITSLSLSGTGITDAGLAHLKESLPRLASIKLMRCKAISDAGLRSLAEVRSLSAIHLADCAQITDAGLEHLLTAKRPFKVVYLLNTGCSADGVEKFATRSGSLMVVNAAGEAAGALAKLRKMADK